MKKIKIMEILEKNGLYIDNFNCNNNLTIITLTDDTKIHIHNDEIKLIDGLNSKYVEHVLKNYEYVNQTIDEIGLTKLEWFAGCYLQNISNAPISDYDLNSVAVECFDIAEKMIKESEKRKIEQSKITFNPYIEKK